MEEVDDGNHMLYYDVVNDSVHHVLGYVSVKEQMNNSCTCRVAEEMLGRPMSMDVSDSKNPQLLFVRGRNEIWASDVDGCHCWQMIKIPSFQGLSVLFLGSL